MPNDLPLPERLAAPLRLVPEPLLRQGSQRLIEQVLAESLEEGRLDEFVGRRNGVEATDLGLRWVVSMGDRRVEVLEPATDAEATVRGTATDLLLLSSRLEDADTLFFHRRLQLTGDVKLGPALRNLLDQLPSESIPLALRIALFPFCGAVDPGQGRRDPSASSSLIPRRSGPARLPLESDAAMAGDRSTGTPVTTTSEDVHRTLIEHANDGIAVVQDARFVFANPSIVAMSGRTAEEFVGLHIAEVFHPEDLPAAVARYEARIRGEPAENRYEIRIRRPDGETRWVGISVVATLWDGRPASLGVVADITARKLLEARLKSALAER